MAACLSRGGSIYGASETKLASPPLPEIESFDVVSSEAIYDPGSGPFSRQVNAVYSLTTGRPVRTSTLPFIHGVGAITGSNIVFVTGGQVMVEPL